MPENERKQKSTPPEVWQIDTYWLSNFSEVGKQFFKNIYKNEPSAVGKQLVIVFANKLLEELKEITSITLTPS